MDKYEDERSIDEIVQKIYKGEQITLSLLNQPEFLIDPEKCLTILPEHINPDGTWHEGTIELAKKYKSSINYVRPINIIDSSEVSERAKKRHQKLFKESKKPSYLKFSKHF